MVTSNYEWDRTTSAPRIRTVEEAGNRLETQRRPVIVIDVGMPMRAMFTLAMRWAIASIPALLLASSVLLIGLNFLMELGLVPTLLQLGVRPSPIEPGLRDLYHRLNTH